MLNAAPTIIMVGLGGGTSGTAERSGSSGAGRGTAQLMIQFSQMGKPMDGRKGGAARRPTGVSLRYREPDAKLAKRRTSSIPVTELWKIQQS